MSVSTCRVSTANPRRGLYVLGLQLRSPSCRKSSHLAGKSPRQAKAPRYELHVVLAKAKARKSEGPRSRPNLEVVVFFIKPKRMDPLCSYKPFR